MKVSVLIALCASIDPECDLVINDGFDNLLDVGALEYNEEGGFVTLYAVDDDDDDSIYDEEDVEKEDERQGLGQVCSIPEKEHTYDLPADSEYKIKDL